MAAVYVPRPCEPVPFRALSALTVLSALALASPAAAAPPLPFGHTCAPLDGALACPTASDAARVPSFDGVPLDVDVLLPPTGDGPFPTIAMLHGFAGSKADPEAGGPASTTNAAFYARNGYAVVVPSARGFGRSCGVPASRTPDCARGWLHLADQRFEVRDVQYLLGLLVDEGVARADALASTGISYGGGQTLELALLRDRVVTPSGATAPWTSPAGRPLSLAAAWARWPWSDLADALLPNGRLGPATFASPVGVPIQAWLGVLSAAAVVDRVRRAAGRRSRRRPRHVERADRPRRALRRGRPRGADGAAPLPLGARGPGAAAHAAPDPGGLHRRPVPDRAVRASLRPPARGCPTRAGGPPARRPRPQPRREPPGRRDPDGRPGAAVLRREPQAGRRHRPRAGIGDGLPAELSALGAARRRAGHRRELLGPRARDVAPVVGRRPSASRRRAAARRSPRD